MFFLLCLIYATQILTCSVSYGLWPNIELEKAFDSVNHDILLSKLFYCGISGKAKSLLKSYLQNRYQTVLITNPLFNSNTVSKWTKIKCYKPSPTPHLLLITVFGNNISHHSFSVRKQMEFYRNTYSNGPKSIIIIFSVNVYQYLLLGYVSFNTL